MRERISELEERFQGRRVMVGVDRLDYIKGVPHKLHAFDVFLEKYPEYRNQVRLPVVVRPPVLNSDCCTTRWR